MKTKIILVKTTTWLDHQARHFVDEQDEYHNESGESDGREFCNKVLADNELDMFKISKFKANSCGCKHDYQDECEIDLIFKNLLDARERLKSRGQINADKWSRWTNQYGTHW